MRVALATAGALPDGDEDAALLDAALAEAGVTSTWTVWDDPSVDWSAVDLVVIRATWDYALRHDEFLAWTERVAAVTSLANPAAVVRANTDKRYLRDLAAAGLAVVPTTWVEPGEVPTLPTAGEYVVKPAVSAGARDTTRYRAGDRAAAAHVARLQAEGRTVMVQPYLDGVDAAGETALVFIDRTYSHALRKGALLTPDAGEVSGLYREEQMSAREPAAAERALAEDVLAAVKGDLLYARVDLIPGPDGAPVLLELELTEPSLFLVHAPEAAGRFAVAIRKRSRS